jgi:hypothetical protein
MISYVLNNGGKDKLFIGNNKEKNHDAKKSDPLRHLHTTTQKSVDKNKKILIELFFLTSFYLKIIIIIFYKTNGGTVIATAGQ